MFLRRNYFFPGQFLWGRHFNVIAASTLKINRHFSPV